MDWLPLLPGEVLPSIAVTVPASALSTIGRGGVYVNETILRRLGNLLSVKSLVTLILTAVFAVMAVRISPGRGLAATCSFRCFRYQPSSSEQLAVRSEAAIMALRAVRGKED